MTNARDFKYYSRLAYRAIGSNVDITGKGKTLNKFGRNLDVSTAYETVMELQGSEINETFVSTNLIDSIASSNAGDTQDIVVEGHTINGSGELTFVSQTVTLTGQTEATLATPLARATRAYVANSGTFDSPQAALAGNVSIYDNTGGQTAGVPTVAAATKLIILAGQTQSEKCSTSISNKDCWFIDEFAIAIGDTVGAANFVTARIEIRDVANGGVWRPLGKEYTVFGGANGIQEEIVPPLFVGPNHDVRLRAKADSGTAEVHGELRGVLGAIQNR